MVISFKRCGLLSSLLDWFPWVSSFVLGYKMQFRALGWTLILVVSLTAWTWIIEHRFALFDQSSVSISKSLLEWSVPVASLWPSDITVTLQWFHGDITVTLLWPLCDPLMTSQSDENPSSKAPVCPSRTTPILICGPIRWPINHPGGRSLRWALRPGREPASRPALIEARFLTAFPPRSLQWPPSTCDPCTWPVSSWLPLPLITFWWVMWPRPRLRGGNEASQVSHGRAHRNQGCVYSSYCVCVCACVRWIN